MKAWHTATLYGKPEDYVSASCKLSGREPRTGSMIVEDYLRPTAIKTKVIALNDKGQTFDSDGNRIRRFGFHVFRHSLCSFLMAEGENPAVIQATLRAYPTGHDHVLRTFQKEAEVGGARPGARSGSRG